MVLPTYSGDTEYCLFRHWNMLEVFTLTVWVALDRDFLCLGCVVRRLFLFGNTSGESAQSPSSLVHLHDDSFALPAHAAACNSGFRYMPVFHPESSGALPPLLSFLAGQQYRVLPENHNHLRIAETAH